MDSRKFHNSLLRPAVLQILRAVGFQSARPHAVEALTEIAALYLRKLGELSATHALSNHNDAVPTITDIRMAMDECGAFGEHSTPAQEAWKEVLRRPLAQLSEGVRESEKAKRDTDDVADVKQFLDWIAGVKNKEIGRIAGWVSDDTIQPPGAVLEEKSNEDYLTTLKKKHSKSGQDTRFQGTVLGSPADDKLIKIDGGAFSSIHEWNANQRRRSAKLVAMQLDDPDSVAETMEYDISMTDG